MVTLEEVIEEYRRVVERKITEAEASKRKLDQLVELQKVKNKRLKGEKLTNDEVYQAQRITCYENIAYCCKYTKQCPWFLACCDTLGLDPKEVSEYKEKIMNSYLEGRFFGEDKAGA